MNVAVVYEKFSRAQVGGAQKSLHTLLDGITGTRTTNVDVYETEPTPNTEVSFEYTSFSTSTLRASTFTVIDQVMFRRQYRKLLVESFRESAYDLVVSQGVLSPLAATIAAKSGIPSIVFVRSTTSNGLEYYDPTQSTLENFLNVSSGKKAQFPFVLRNIQECRTGYQAASALVANSEYTAQVLSQGFGVDSTVIYPPIDLEEYRTELDPHGPITIINPRREAKGLDIFLQIAQHRPDEEFLVVGKTPSKKYTASINNRANVRHLSWCNDMRKAYGQAKLVVVPSQHNEPFGRVAAEAMVSGIPCVVSSRGGLPEVVGDTGIVVDEVTDPEAWIDAIDVALAEHDPDAQRSRVERFSAERQIERFDELIEDLTS